MNAVEEKNENLEELLNLNSEIERNNHNINLKDLEISELRTYSGNLVKDHEEYRRYKKSYYRSIKLLVLSTLLTISASVAIAFPFSKKYSAKEYTYNGISIEESDTVVKEKHNKTYVIVTEPLNFKEKSVSYYDVSDVELTNIEDYMNLDLSDRKCEVSKTTTITNEEKDELFNTLITVIEKMGTINEESIDEEFIMEFKKLFKSLEESNLKVLKEVVKTEVNADVSYSRLVINSLLIYLAIIFILILFDLFVQTDILISPLMRFAYNEIELEEGMKFFSFNAKNNSNFEKMGREIQNILKEIKENEILRNRFVELFNENKYLLLDPSALLEEYKRVVDSFDISALKEKYEDLDGIHKEISKLKIKETKYKCDYDSELCI